MEAFVAVQIVCQVLLLFDAIGPFRVVVRSAALGMSLVLLILLRGPAPLHPARRLAYAALALVGLSLFHPSVNSFASALAQFFMYVAILAPLAWVPRAAPDPATLRRVLLAVWSFHAVSATFGVLQVYFPGRFRPRVSAVIEADPDYLRSLQITLPDGQTILRPMGLSDIPGGAGTAGFYAVLLGLTFLALERSVSRRVRVAAVGSIWLGLFCLYVAQVRATLVLTAICALVFLALLARSGRITRNALLVGVLGVAVVGALAWATAVAGESVTGRVSSLWADDPGATYYRSRGRFLAYTIDVLLPQYPLGAGPGRWGMMSAYFGDPSNRASPALWAEIQWTGWLLDGGLPLVLLYFAAVLVAIRTAYQLVRRVSPTSPSWPFTCFLVAYGVGALALTFSYPVFHSQTGLEFWLLNALVYTVHVRARRGRR